MTRKQRNIVICFPGNSWGVLASRCWDVLREHFHQGNADKLWIQRAYFPGVQAVRNKVLIGKPSAGADQKPFQGQFDYTHVLWIDQDILYTPEDFERLISYDKDIVAGIYPTADGLLALGAFGADTNDALKIRSFRTLDLQSVAFSGFGFMLMKRGVLESLGYPWFVWEPQHSQSVFINEPATEDVPWGQRIRRKGFEIFVDPRTPVKHWKEIAVECDPQGVEKFVDPLQPTVISDAGKVVKQP